MSTNSSRSAKDRALYPLVSVDVALCSLVDGKLKVLLVRRDNEPQRGRWALPGGVLDPGRDADLERTARRVLREKTDVGDVPYLEQVRVFSGRERDPRGWSLSVLFCALLPLDQVPAHAGRKVAEVAWRDAGQPGGGLAFDHARHVAAALALLRDTVGGRALPLHLLRDAFTLTELQRAVEAILGTTVEKSAFRRRLRDDPSLEPIEGAFHGGAQRPAQLYRAAPGFSFEKPLRS
jgi:ADP-ribose pyrophosphatase YjhB (NUDIX family)